MTTAGEIELGGGVTAMTQTDKDRFFNMASCYGAMAPYLVPCYAWFQERMLDLLFEDDRADKFVVDLGAGSGLFLDRLLRRYPEARGAWVDYSADFQEVARKRLSPHGDRVRFILARLEENWEDQLEGAPDAICSMSAIHHLTPVEKRRLYERCHRRLKPGGWFLNCDEMRADDPAAYLNTLLYWVRFVDRTAPTVPAERREPCRAWCEKFEGWKDRNIVHRGQPQLPGDDIHERYIDQLLWLREIGLADADLLAKFQLWCLIGGRKPQ
jgi:tRNA (cmo5U34)-methyltransferase